MCMCVCEISSPTLAINSWRNDQYQETDTRYDFWYCGDKNEKQLKGKKKNVNKG